MVLKEGIVPNYKAKCDECGTEFTYQRKDTLTSSVDGFGTTICPVCHCEVWVTYEKFEVEKT